MDLIDQQLVIKDWPLTKIGDEKFFGYVVAMGIFPRDWGEEHGMIAYVDFAYNDSYERFRLPEDMHLKRHLMSFLWDNMNGVAGSHDIYGKVWIKLTKKGYSVFLP